MEQSTAPDIDKIYRVLAAPLRRQILELLIASTPVREISELAERLCGTDSTADDRERAMVRLQHVHLPVLSDAELVEWDTERGMVEPTGTVDQLPLGLMTPSLASASRGQQRQQADD